MNFIALDWGVSILRAWRIENGECSTQLQLERGINTVADKQFESLLLSVIAPWRDWIESKQAPILMTGMIGSNVESVKSGYQFLPLDVNTLTTTCIAVKSELTSPIWLRPGIANNDRHQADIMHGEQVQLLGALALYTADIYVFPSTHSRWVIPRRQAGQVYIDDVTTVMTGELYQLLMSSSLVNPSIENVSHDHASFIAGVMEAQHQQKGIIAQAFKARSRQTLGYLAAEQAASWLSGLLIGDELAHLKRYHPASANIAFVGDTPLVSQYRQAAELIGFYPVVIDRQSATLQGFKQIYAEL